jgi:hypothetical protein
MEHCSLVHPGEQLVYRLVNKRVEILLGALSWVDFNDVVSSTRPALADHSVSVVDRFV